MSDICRIKTCPVISFQLCQNPSFSRYIFWILTHNILLFVLCSKFQKFVLKLKKHTKTNNLTNLVSKLTLKPNLLNCFDFTIFLKYVMKIRQKTAVCLFQALVYFLNSRNSIWSWQNFQRWRIWQIWFQSWCWNQTC